MFSFDLWVLGSLFYHLSGDFFPIIMKFEFFKYFLVLYGNFGFRKFHEKLDWKDLEGVLGGSLEGD